MRKLYGVIAAVLFGGLWMSAAVAAPGDPLGPPFTVQADGDGTLIAPAVARAANGDFVVVYSKIVTGSSQRHVFARLYHADGTPKGPAFVASETPRAFAADVAMDADGNFVVAWWFVGTGEHVVARRFAADGSALGGEIQVSEPLQTRFGRPVMGGLAVSLNADGNFVVAWSEGRVAGANIFFLCNPETHVLCTSVGSYTVRARRFLDGGIDARPAHLVALAGNATVQVLSPTPTFGAGGVLTVGGLDVVMEPDNAFFVTWNRTSSSNNILTPLTGVYVQRFTPAGLPGLERIVSTQRGMSGMPSIAMDAGGSYLVAYRRDPRAFEGDDARGVYARLFSAGALLGGPEFRVDEPAQPPADVLGPSLAMDPAGNFVVAWKSDDTVLGQRHATGGGALGINFRVDTPASAPTGAARVSLAMDAAGDFAMVWAAADGSIQGRLYEGP